MKTVTITSKDISAKQWSNLMLELNSNQARRGNHTLPLK